MIEDISVKFGKRVRELRLQKKLSQGKLAKIFGVHPTYISGIERGKRNLSLKNIEKLAGALGVQIEDLVNTMNGQLFVKVDEYIGQLLAPEDEVLISTIKSLHNAGMPQHSISANQGKFLQILAMLCSAKNILEIGTLGGYSAIWLARALPDDGKLTSIELDINYIKVAKQNIVQAKLQNKIDIRAGEALKILDTISDTFDMIFIDAHKPSCTKYFEWSLGHVHRGTLIVADNVIREGKVLDKNSQDEKVLGVQQFNSVLAKSEKVTATIISNIGIKGYDGMAIAIVK